MIEMYTDGAAKGNPGPGACAVILVAGSYQKEFVQAFRKTTNNRMELGAVIMGLAALKKDNQSVMVYSDSRYVIDPVEKGWLWRWLETDFQGKKNSDLWQKYWALAQRHNIKFNWVKGHAGHSYNEACDRLATAAIRQGSWAIDEVYENILK
jgi:ribonuclease HI